MRKSTQYILFFFLFMGISQAVWAQQYTVTGTVTDNSTGKPLSGANVYNKASSHGTSTNKDGKFTLQLANGPTTLRISFIGYVTRTVKVSPSNNRISVSLKLETTNLNQLVVTGLAGTTKRENLANDVTKVSSKELTGTVSTSTISDALDGKVPGVTIKSTSGAPGGGFNVEMRGISTLGGGSSQPLYIIDGVYVNNSTISTGRWRATGANSGAEDQGGNRLADLNPDNIKSIQVLKGPSAAAIYGERANAGVVIIHTKRGSTGPTQIHVSESAGFASPLKLLGVASWDEQKIKDKYSDSRLQEELKRYEDAKSAGKFYNYEKILYDHKGIISKTNLSASGGNDKTKFFVAGGLHKENGIIKNTGFNRGSFRANLDHNITDGIKISTNSYFVKSNEKRGFTGNQNGSGGSLGYTIAYVPTYANLFPDENGVYPSNPYFNANPLQTVKYAKNDEKTTRTIQSFNLNADLYRGGGSVVSFILNGGIDYLNFNSEVYLPNFLQSQQSAANPGDVIRTKEDHLNTNLQAFLKYIQDTKDFTFTTQAGFSRSGQLQHRQELEGQGLIPGQENVTSAKVQIVHAQGKQHIIDTGLFGQEKINWGDKLIATGGVRLDRSSENYHQNHYYVFPKASLAANISNFDFFNVDAMNQLKLRIAYGQTGNVPNYGDIYQVLNSTHVGSQVGLVISNRDIDPNLVPERGIGLEFGLDLGFFNNRVSLSATHYTKTIKDLILDLPTASSTGITAIATNAGTLRNNGIELSLNATLVQGRGFTWNMFYSYYQNRTKITELNIPAFDTGGFGVSLGDYLIQEGFSPATIVGTGGGEPEGDALHKIYGSSRPKFQMSLGNTLNFLNGFQLSFLFHWNYGNDNINLHQFLTDGGETTADFGSKAYQKRQSEAPPVAYVQNASSLRLKQVGLHYTVPASFLDQAVGSAIKNIRLGVAVNNVYLITPYPGYDTNINAFGVQAVNTSVAVAPYPSSRKILFSIDFKF
jgi:TonB-linked SusC/RagA family outer membrane protein